MSSKRVALSTAAPDGISSVAYLVIPSVFGKSPGQPPASSGQINNWDLCTSAFASSGSRRAASTELGRGHSLTDHPLESVWRKGRSPASVKLAAVSSCPAGSGRDRKSNSFIHCENNLQSVLQPHIVSPMILVILQISYSHSSLRTHKLLPENHRSCRRKRDAFIVKGQLGNTPLSFDIDTVSLTVRHTTA